MDIMDILLASALSPQATVQVAMDEIQEALSNADRAATQAADAAAQINQMIEQITKPEFVIEQNESEYVREVELKIKENNEVLASIGNKYYKNAGSNEDGTMTQKAITNYVNTKIQEIEVQPSSDTDLGEENSGSVVVVGEDGKPTSGTITETSLIRTQILTGTYQAYEALGLEIDYENKSFNRIQDARGLSAGQDFNAYPMYGGINRCLVDDNGEIISFFGDDLYMDNFSTGYQTMVYIPKFYYMRVPLSMNGNVIKKEVIIISAIKQNGFKVHPAFINDDGEELDYFLYSAYEGSTFNVAANAYNRNDSLINFEIDKLSSVTNAKPISGVNNDLNYTNAEKLAKNRGENWSITTIKALSAIQMLMLIEFGTLNMQDALEKGICNIDNILGKNCASITGSTAALGNTTGHAVETVNERNGLEYTYSDNGRRAINYRGIENPYGNIWSIVGGIEVRGNGDERGGIPYIDGHTLGFMLPASSEWISGFGYSSAEYDWAFIPAQAIGANNAVPVGDYVWVNENLDGVNGVVAGGHWGFKENNGIFYYGFDKSKIYSDRTYSARAMLTPSKNAIYQQNIELWKKIGGIV